MFCHDAAAGSAAEEMFGVNYRVGVAVSLIICAFVMSNGMGALEILSVVLVPALIIGIAAIGENLSVIRKFFSRLRRLNSIIVDNRHMYPITQ